MNKGHTTQQRPDGARWTPDLKDLGGLVLAGLWAVLVLSYSVGMSGALAANGLPRALAILLCVLGAFVPLALAGLAVSLRHVMRSMQEVSPAEVSLPSMPSLPDPSPQIKALDRQIADLTKRVATLSPRPTSASATEPEAAVAPPAPVSQAVQELPLEPAPKPKAEPLSEEELVLALDFPRDARDQRGFAILERATQFRPLAELLQAAEDVMNLMSQHGVYMDDLSADALPANALRGFFSGRRDTLDPYLDPDRDAVAHDKVRAQMSDDLIYRDSVLHFMRRFEMALGGFHASVTDETLEALMETRTGRAFVLLARANGSLKPLEASVEQA